MDQEILIRGDVSETDLIYLRTIYGGENIIVAKYETKGAIGGIEQVIQIIFHDFNSIGFARDLVIAKILEASLKYILNAIRKALVYFKSKKKAVRKTVTISVKVACTNGSVRLQFTIDLDREELFFKLLITLLTQDFIDSLCSYSEVFFIQEENNIRYYGH